MSIIFKYMLPVPTQGPRTELLPKGGEVIHVQDFFMWILLPDQSAEVEQRTFETYPTGWQFNSTKHKHLGTWLEVSELSPDPLVWHAFERF